MRIAPLALALLAALAVPADAASRSTARASGTIPLRAGPGSGYYIVGQLAGGTRVHLDQCTCGSNWCLVLVDGDPAGWARGSYLVGSAAKMEVTPTEPLFQLNRRDRLGHFFHEDHDDAFADQFICR